MEFGVGLHGERGRETVPLQRAGEIVTDLAAVIEAELEIKTGQQVLLHINGFGSTPLIELYAVYELAAQYWQSRGVGIIRSLVGNYTTSLDMAGCSMTVTLMDEVLTELWDAPVHTASLRW
jgi:dihydroxyacetone kinase-like protein